ncbi:MAG TPA: cellulose synthase subunit BcsC-related outer membrane protein, partial [Phenylobacterium sp.]|uniref:cellulose synthase subunit BcsC-related outer membrane protein n=1 Tax=Phenylobacterium sp. TaxID=1871053 RepID=UPI002B46C442
AADLGFRLGATSFKGRPTGFSGEARWSPKPANDVQAELALVRRPVMDSLLAYAGTEDPRAGVSWGQVSRSGAQGGLTLTRGDLGAYAVLAGYAYDGRRVRSNASAQLDVGGYAQLYRRGSTVLKGGLNLDLQAYRRNENAFTFGHGGYFSPQQFVSLTVPLRFSRKTGAWRIEAQVSPGWEHYREGDAPVFPTAPAWQAQLPAGQSTITGSRKQGLGVSGEARAEYSLGPRLLVGAEVGGDTFGAYRETHAALRLRLRFAGR